MNKKISNGHFVWSFVVQEKVSDQEAILACLYDEYNGSGLNFFYLNNQTNFPLLPDIADTLLNGNRQKNRKPVVSFSNWELNDMAIYYGWFYERGDIIPMTPPAFTIKDNAYIGLKVEHDISLVWNDDQYYMIMEDPDNLSSINKSRKSLLIKRNSCIFKFLNFKY